MQETNNSIPTVFAGIDAKFAGSKVKSTLLLNGKALLNLNEASTFLADRIEAIISTFSGNARDGIVLQPEDALSVSSYIRNGANKIVVGGYSLRIDVTEFYKKFPREIATEANSSETSVSIFINPMVVNRVQQNLTLLYGVNCSLASLKEYGKSSSTYVNAKLNFDHVSKNVLPLLTSTAHANPVSEQKAEELPPPPEEVTIPLSDDELKNDPRVLQIIYNLQRKGFFTSGFAPMEYDSSTRWVYRDSNELSTYSFNDCIEMRIGIFDEIIKLLDEAYNAQTYPMVYLRRFTFVETQKATSESKAVKLSCCSIYVQYIDICTIRILVLVNSSSGLDNLEQAKHGYHVPNIGKIFLGDDGDNMCDDILDDFKSKHKLTHDLYEIQCTGCSCMNKREGRLYSSSFEMSLLF